MRPERALECELPTEGEESVSYQGQSSGMKELEKHGHVFRLAEQHGKLFHSMNPKIDDVKS